MLTKIVAKKREELRTLQLPEYNDVNKFSLVEALKRRTDRLGLIAEVKKASPSKGILIEQFNPLQIAKQYEIGGADAISVLTDETFFQGNGEYLIGIKRESKLPILRKDFIIDSLQVEESVRMGADAILLIATILERNQLKELFGEATEKGLECLIEVHDVWDLEKVLSTITPDIIGINNRDLRTFETDIHQSLKISKEIPPGIVVVSESGIKSKHDLTYLRHHVDAVLIGETFMRAPSPLIGIQQLFGE